MGGQRGVFCGLADRPCFKCLFDMGRAETALTHIAGGFTAVEPLEDWCFCLSVEMVQICLAQ